MSVMVKDVNRANGLQDATMTPTVPNQRIVNNACANNTCTTTTGTANEPDRHGRMRWTNVQRANSAPYASHVNSHYWNEMEKRRTQRMNELQARPPLLEYSSSLPTQKYPVSSKGLVTNGLDDIEEEYRRRMRPYQFDNSTNNNGNGSNGGRRYSSSLAEEYPVQKRQAPHPNPKPPQQPSMFNQPIPAEMVQGPYQDQSQTKIPETMPPAMAQEVLTRQQTPPTVQYNPCPTYQPYGYRNNHLNYNYQPMYTMDNTSLMHGQPANTTVLQNNMPNEQAAASEPPEMMDQTQDNNCSQAQGEPHQHYYQQAIPHQYMNQTPQYVPQQSQ